MSDKTIELKIDNSKFLESMDKLAETVSNLRPTMKKIAGIMHSAVEENFRQQGRPKWDDLAPSTKKQRAKKGHWPGLILQVKGALASSVTTKWNENSAVVGSNLAYARIHQLGGEINHPAQPRLIGFKTYKRGKHAGKTLFAKRRSADFGMKVSGKAYSVKMKARPYLSVTESDLNKINDVVFEDLKNI